MNIIIVGDGKVGYTLAENLSREDNNVTIIDKDPEALRKASETLDVMCIKGNGVSVKTLLEAGVRTADLLIAAASSDEMNMVCALTAKKLGSAHTVARIRDPEYASELSMLKNELGLNMVINPEQAAAYEIARLLQFPSAINIESFAKGRVDMVELKVDPGDPIVNIKLKKLQSRFNTPILIAAIERNEKVIIPGGETVIEANDTIYIVGRSANTFNFCKVIGKCARKLRNVMIVGGGRITYYLSGMISEIGLKVKIIEMDKERCLELSEMLPEALIINGDGTSEELLMSENLSDMHAFIAMTGRDEENLILSLLAKQSGVQKAIAKVTRMQYSNIIKNLGIIDSIISPRLITTNHILRYVRGIKNAHGNTVEALYRIVNGQAEILEFIIYEDRWFLNTALRKLKFVQGALIATIVRDNEIIIPHGNDLMKLHDRVIIVTRTMNLERLDDAFIPGAEL